MIAMAGISANGKPAMSWIDSVEKIAIPKPTAISMALRRSGAG